MWPRQTCLVVDDSDVVRKVVRITIEDLGLEVHEAASVAEAMTRCKSVLPDLIVLDWHLPGGSALEFIAAVRSAPKGRMVKILYVPTDDDNVDIGRAIAAGANDYMIKPFERITLEAKVAALITERREPIPELESLPLPRAASF